MTMSHTVVRPARPDDIPALVTMWERMWDLDAHVRRNPTDPERLATRLAGLLQDPSCRLLVALHDDEIGGLAVLSAGRLTPLVDGLTVHVHHMVVAGHHRRRGLGRALLSAASAWAEEIGADEMSAHVSPTLRETQRFYARLGFQPFVVRRVATTAALRRRLSPGPEPVRRRAILRRTQLQRGLTRDAVLDASRNRGAELAREHAPS